MLQGCSAPATMPAQDISTIRTVLVHQQPAVAPRFQYQTRALVQVSGPIASLAGPAYVDKSNASTAQCLAQVIDQYGISVFEIAKAQFIADANARSQITFGDVTPVKDGELSLTVDYFGFSRRYVFGRMVSPVIGVTAELYRYDGKLVWQKSAFVSALSHPDVGESVQDYLDEPQRMRQAFERAAKLAVEQLVDDLPSR